MKLGFNLLLWSTHVTEELFPTLEKIKKVGYDGVEIPVFQGDVAHFQKIGKALRDNGLRCTAVTVIPSEEHNTLSDDPARRQKGLAWIKWAVDCCQAMGAETLLGPYHQPLGVFTGGAPTEQEKANAASVHREAAQYAQGKCTLAIEYLNRFECYFLNTLADAAAHVARVNHPNFGTMFDTFHANIEEKEPVTVILKHAKAIRHVHISENDRGCPGDGHAPIRETIRALQSVGYDGWMVIEAFGRALPDLAAATRVWRDFFPSREYVYEKGFRYLQQCLGK